MSAPPPDKSVEGISTPIAAVHSRTTSPNISASSTTATLAAAHPHPSSLPDHTSSPTATPAPVRTAGPGLASSPNLMPLSSTPLSGARPGSGPSSPTHGERHTLPSWLWHTTHTTSYTSDKAGTRRRDVRERRLFGMVVSAHAQEESLDGRDGLDWREGQESGVGTGSGSGGEGEEGDESKREERRDG